MHGDAYTLSPVSRRRFGAVAGGALASLAFGGACLAGQRRRSGDGRISARPRRDVDHAGTGTTPLGLGESRDAVLQLPDRESTGAVPLLVLLHGAGGSGAGILRRLGAAAKDAGVAVLAPDARDSTWDAIRGGFGPDVAFLNRALQRVFDTVAIDDSRVAVGGFSDGATYALSLGLINGDLFRRVLAFSPGFIVEGTRHGKSRFFISHGRSDDILPIDRCSRVIVPALQRAGYHVTFREFAGGHQVPEDVAREGMRWAAAAKQAAEI
jgi:predicted esterase